MELLRLHTAVLSILLLILSGCEVTDTPVNDTGQLIVKLTDAPGDFEAVYVDIQSVQIKQDDSEEWITIGDNPVRVNLLELRNGNTIQLGSEELQTGTYHQMRLVLGSDNNIVVNNNSYSLNTPSAQQSGLKLGIETEIIGGKMYTILIDFDAGRSVVATGNGNYLLKPVLRAVELKEAGTIAGSVEPKSVQTSVLAVSNDDTLSTLTDETGDFKIMGVPEGMYEVIFKPRNSTYAEITKQDIEVSMKNTVNLGTITLETL